MTLTESNACYNARRVIRASDPAKFARKIKVDGDPLTMRLVEILPPLLENHCVALAEAIAIEQARAEEHKQNSL